MSAFSRPISLPIARLRQAFAVLPLFATLASAHPKGNPHPIPPFHPPACLEAGSLDFGRVQVGTRKQGSLPVANRCAHAITIWKVAGGSKDFASALPGSLRLAPRGKGSIPVAYTPADTGADKATLTIYATPPAGSALARVSGIGTAPPAPTAGITVSPASIQLSMDPAQTDTFRLAVTNHGTSPRAEILVDAIGSPQPRPDRGWRVMYLNTSMYSFWDDQLMTRLRPLANVDTIAAWYGGDSLPSLARMQEYDIVMVASGRQWKDSVAVGDLLADYLEAGGKVLLTASTMNYAENPLYGRIQDYEPVGKGSSTYHDTSAILPPHPITAGIAGFASGDILNVSTTRGQGIGIPLGSYSRGALVGAYHPDKPLVFLNIGSYELNGDIAPLFGNAFDYLGGMMAWMTPRPPFDPVIFVVPDGETRELKVAVNTYRLPAGTHAGAIRLLNSSDTNAVPIDVPVSLAVTSVRRLAVDPESVDFGATWQGSRATHSVRLVNIGSAATHVTGFTTDGPFGLSTGLPLEIPAFSYALVNATFAPTETGADSAALQVRSDAEEASAPTIELRGSGIVPPILSVSPRGFDVTLAEGDSSYQPLSIRNPGGDSLKLTLRAVVDSAAGIRPTGPAKLKVLYLQTTGQSFESVSDFFLWGLLDNPNVDSLVSYSGYDSTPSLEYLRKFDAVIAVSEASWADSEAVGNRLADYVDAGGRVILMGAVLYNGPGFNPALGGRITTPDYAPVAPASWAGQNSVQQIADDPIMEGIDNYLYTDWAMNATTTQGGGIPLGTYSTGALIGAYNPRKPVVFINVLPHDGDYSQFQTIRLLGNSLRHLSEFYNWLRPTQRTLALGPGEEASVPIRFGASYGLPAGSYTGRLDLFHNDPATGNPLAVPATLTVQPGSQTAATAP